MQKKIKQAKKYLEWGKPNQAIAELKPTLNSNRIQKEFKWVPNHLMGIALSLQGKSESAITYLEKAVMHGSNQAETFLMLSERYNSLGKLEEAEKYGKEAVQLKDNFLKGWMNLGGIYQAQAKLDQALECYQRANQIDPKNAGVAYNIGKIYRDQGDLDQAMKLFDITLQVDEDHLKAMLERADLFKNNGRLDEALEKLEEAKEKHGSHPAITVSKAEVSRTQGDYDQAIELYEEILEDFPDNGPLLINYALCLQEVGRFDKSEKHYREAISLMGDSRNAISNYLMGLHYNPENSREYIFNEHIKYCKEFTPEEGVEELSVVNKDPNKKLKVGFISGGFRRHPVGWMIAGALEQLRDEDFELISYTTDNRFDFITRRIHRNIDQWKSIIGYSDTVIKNIILDDELDILVDLTGHAADNCMNVMGHKPAPVMVKWVGGLFNTTGLEAFDHLITDWHESPEGEESYYTEKLVRMPDDYIVYVPPAYAPEVDELPAEENEHITFGCFNNPTKVNERVLGHWADIMQQVPESHLYLKSKQYDTTSFREQILDVMDSEGIAKERIEFEGRTGHEEHLAAYNKIDIALDPWPYSGGLTTCEALYMGVPVITMPGPTFAGRHSTTHLINAGLEQWVTDSWEEYTEKAVTLANDLDELKEWRNKLRDQLLNSPVCDGKRFGAHLSVAFREMWKQWMDGYQNDEKKWQDHITVNPLLDEQVQELTDGPNTTPLITVKDMGDTEESDLTVDKDLQNKTTEESMIDTEELVRDVVQNENGHSRKSDTAGIPPKQSGNGNENYFVETKDVVTICAPADLDVLTTYVLLEQEQWFEPELNFVRQFVESGMHIVDVGAGFGAYALPMAKMVGGQGRVSAFEPSVDMRQYLEKSKVENDLNQLEVYVHGLAEETKRAAVEQAKTPELHTLTEGDDISVSTLDKWWGFIGQPDIDLVKIDVNGMESQVLEGGQTLFNKISPVVIASIGEEASSLQRLQDQFKEIDYALYEYIPGPGLLAEHEPEAGVDPYLMNLVGIPQSRIEEIKENGLVFDESVEVEATDQHRWKQVLERQSWTESKIDAWADKVSGGNHSDYIEALNLACTAEQIVVSEAAPKSRSRKGATMLAAAQKLIGLFNSGNGDVSAALTYVRVMAQLGKTMQAVEMAKQLMETVNSERDISVDLPFLPPLPEQDTTDIQTDFSKWLTVRVVEAWIELQNPTTYMAGEQERGMLEALEGNPEAIISTLKEESKSTILTNGKVDKEQKVRDTFGISSNNKLKHIYLGFPGKQGGAHGIHELRVKKLAGELERQGVKTSVVSTSENGFIQTTLEASKEDGHAFYTGVMGYDLFLNADMGLNGNLFDLLDVPVFGFLGDHPYTNFMWRRMQNSARNMTFIAPFPSLKFEYEQIFPSNNSVEILENVPPPIREGNKKSYKLIEDRPIDLLIPWGIHKFFTQESSLGEQLKKMGNEPYRVGKKLYQKGVKEYNKSIFELFLDISSNELVTGGYSFKERKTKEDQIWLNVLSIVDWHIRKQRRLLMLEMLSDVSDNYQITVTAHPKVAELITAIKDKSNINWIGQVSVTKLEKLYEESKVVLNCNPTYPDTMHARIRSGLMKGCYVLSDYNPRLKDELGSDNLIGFVEDGKDIVNELSTDWEQLSDKIAEGRAHIESRYNTELQAQKLIKIIKQNLI